jgi:N-acetylneuraminic acid mutarotase
MNIFYGRWRMCRLEGGTTRVLLVLCVAVAGCGEPAQGPVTVSVPGEGGGAAEYTWTPIAPLPEPRFETGVAVVDGKLWVLGGFTDRLKALTSVVAYDPEADAWAHIAELPENTTHMNVVRDGRTLWYAGGFVGDNPGVATANVWKFDVDAGAFAAGPALPEARGAGALVLLGRELHFIGGLLADRRTDSGDHWVLELDGGAEWRSAAALLQPKNHHVAAAVDGKIYVLGGQLGHDQVHFEGPWEDLDTVHVYDPESDAWEASGRMPKPLSHVEPSTFVANGRVVIMGGRALLHETAAAWAFSPGDGTWTSLPPLPAPGRGVIAALIDGTVYTAGGRFYRDPISSAAWKGDAALGWEAILAGAV